MRHGPGLPAAVPAASTSAAFGPLSRIEVFRDFAAAEPHWRALESDNALATPYQRFDFLSLWMSHIGAPAGMTPFIVVGFDAGGTPLFLWPLGLRTFAGMRTLMFLGGKHANFNLALWRREFAAVVTRGEIERALAGFAGEADAVLFTNQSLTWQGTTNPFAALPNQTSANLGYSGALAHDFDALLRARTNAAARKKIRKKQTSLASFGEVKFERAGDPATARRVLDAFFKQKSVRMRTQGVRDVFATPEVRRFIEAAVTENRADGSPVVELYALSVDDIIVATMGGISAGGRFCAMFNSIIPDRYAAESPGEQLILNLVRACCERGLDTFDLGVGEARYKNLLCGDAEPLFDTFLALTPKGHVLTAAARAGAAFKRLVKHSPTLWSMVRTMRRLRACLASA